VTLAPSQLFKPYSATKRSKSGIEMRTSYLIRSLVGMGPLGLPTAFFRFCVRASPVTPTITHYDMKQMPPSSIHSFVLLSTIPLRVSPESRRLTRRSGDFVGPNLLGHRSPYTTLFMNFNRSLAVKAVWLERSTFNRRAGANIPGKAGQVCKFYINLTLCYGRLC